jgi:predicted RNA-binding protein associated with RNAse of E/G family
LIRQRRRRLKLDGIHPPKRETFDLTARTNTDPKGIVRAVDVYTRQAWGLYMARPTPGRAQFHYLESWLLPTLGLRANIFHWNPGHEREQDFYLDVCDITVDGAAWRMEDHYIDLVVHTGDRTELIDVDELLQAYHVGLVSSATTERAIRTAVAAIEGLAANGHDLHAWLSGNGMALSWR